jgi:hypothetical protein
VDSDPSRNRDRLVVSVALASTVALVALVGRALVALVGGALVALVGGALIVVALVALVGGALVALVGRALIVVALVALVGRALIVVALVALVGLVGGALIVVALVAVAGVRLVALVVLDPSSKVTTSRAGASIYVSSRVSTPLDSFSCVGLQDLAASLELCPSPARASISVEPGGYPPDRGRRRGTHCLPTSPPESDPARRPRAEKRKRFGCRGAVRLTHPASRCR